MQRAVNIFIAFCFSIFIITGIIKLTVEYKGLYYYSINKLNIVELSNMDKEEIKLNYDYLIEYNTSKEDTEFEIPTIKSSVNGKIHFEEVRDIYQVLDKIFYLSLMLSIVGILLSIKNRSIEFLNITSMMIIGIPVVLAIPLIVDFDRSFVIFHEILFDNDYWIFDPILDPVINILPSDFFMYSGIMILVLILISSIVTKVLYIFLKKKKRALY